MRRPIGFWLLLGIPYSLLAQAPASLSHMDAGVISHEATAGTLTANNPRPLMSAITAINEEYGWTVDFEDPPYRSNFDLIDDTAPQWRAEHPNAKGVTRVSGGLFKSSFPEPSTISDNAEEQVLQKLVSDYNATGNPGRFAIRKEEEGRFAVVGVARKDVTGKDEPVEVLLDTPMSMPEQRRTAKATLQAIVDALSAKTGVKVYLGTIGLSSDPLHDLELEIGGTNVPARTLLLQVINQASNSQYFRGILIWRLLFNADDNAYALRLKPATIRDRDATGRPVVRFLERK
jgi:hypothetical protein